jgi:hypothetical protein
MSPLANTMTDGEPILFFASEYELGFSFESGNRIEIR